MANPQIKVGIGIDGAGFQKGAKMIMGQIGELKGALLAGLGIGALSEMIVSAIEFAKETQRSADELGVSISRAMQLNHVMEMVGKNSHAWVLSMGKVQDYMEGAYNDASKMAKLKQLGITPNAKTGEFNFNFNEILKQALVGSQKMGATERRMLFDDIFGRKMGADIIYKEKEILATPEEAGIKESQIREVIELNAQFKELKETISILILEGLVPLMEWSLQLVAGYKRDTKIMDELSAEASSAYMKSHGGKLPNSAKLLALDMSYQLDMAVKNAAGASKSDIEKSQRETLEAKFGKEATDEAYKNWSGLTYDPMKQLEAAKQRGKEATEAAIKAREGGSALKRPEGTAVRIASNEMVKVGGLLGVDTTYRLQQDLLNINKEQLDRLNRIVENTNPRDMRTPPSIFPVQSPTPPPAHQYNRR